MKIITAGVTSAMLAVGIAGSVAAYRTQAVTPDARPASQETVEEVSPTTAPAKPHPKVRWAPCPEGSSLEKGTCVTDVVRTIVLPAPSPTGQPTPTPQAAAMARAHDDDSDDSDDSDHSDDADHDEADEPGDDHGDDHDEDDDHEDDDHEDDDHEDDDHEDED